MVNQALFDKYFSQIEDSFTRNIPQKNKEGWYEEIHKCKPEYFALTMQKLKRGDRFPNFGNYWEAYRIVKIEGAGCEEEAMGCRYCREGWLHVMAGTRTSIVPGSKPKYGFLSEGHLDNLDGDREVVLACKKCQPGVRGAVWPDKPWKFVFGMEPSRKNKEVLIPPTIALAMIQELVDKMAKPGIDWAKETEEAWSCHDQLSLVKGGAE